MPDKVVLEGCSYKIKRLRPYHFLECAGGIPFDVFDLSKQAVGVYAQMMADLEQQESENELKEEDLKRIRIILEAGVEDFDFEKTLAVQGVKHVQDLSNIVLCYSLETFKKVFKPSPDMLVNCHYLAKNYGGRPTDYIKQPIDHYLFDFHCLVAGIKDENAQLKKAQKRR